MRNIFFTGVISFGLVLSGCSATYTPPVSPSSNLVISNNVHASKSEILKATQKTLALNGEQISTIDTVNGIITTSPKTLRLTPEHADCGKTMGIDYLKDNRTNSKMFYNIIVEDNKLAIKGVPSAEYRVGAADQDMNLTCVSHGVLEQQLFEQIKNNF